MSDFYRNHGKRWFDVLISASALALLGPLLAVIAVVVRAKLGAPVLFRQVRPGRGGRQFTLLKFRSMSDACDHDGQPLADAVRLTTLGQFLRSSSLDELPELWNVLRGDMSLVGPRPLLPEYLPRYTARQARRHEALPGVTGLAQVRGRNALSWEERFELDVAYVESVSLWGDVAILFRTVACVVQRRGVSAPHHATMPPFEGSTYAMLEGNSR